MTGRLTSERYTPITSRPIGNGPYRGCAGGGPHRRTGLSARRGANRRVSGRRPWKRNSGDSHTLGGTTPGPPAANPGAGGAMMPAPIVVASVLRLRRLRASSQVANQLTDMLIAM